MMGQVEEDHLQILFVGHEVKLKMIQIPFCFFHDVMMTILKTILSAWSSFHLKVIYSLYLMMMDDFHGEGYDVVGHGTTMIKATWIEKRIWIYHEIWILIWTLTSVVVLYDIVRDANEKARYLNLLIPEPWICCSQKN